MAIDTKIITNLDGSLTVASKQDDKAVKKVADFNKQDKFSSGTRNKYKGDSQFSHRVARIPLIVVEKMREWLNHPDNAPWRTTKGKV